MRSWKERCASGWVALSLMMLTHCADSPAEEGPATREQGLATISPADCMPRRERYTERWFPTADAYVSRDAPSSNFGQAPVLLVDGSPRLESYLKFDVSTSGLTLLDARLELFALDPTSNGPLLYRTNTGWDETTLTWNTKPGLLGSPLGNLGAINANSWASYDVTGVVTGTGSYGFGLIPEGRDGVDFVSREVSDIISYPRLRLTVETPPYCSYRGTGGGLTGWARQIGGVGGEQLQALATDSAGGFVAAGLFGDAVFPEGEGFALARYAADGTFLWGRVLATDDVEVRSLTVTPQGNIFVVGSYEGSPDLGTGPLPPVPEGGLVLPGLFFAKFSPSGALLWLRSFTAGSTNFSLGLITPSEVATDAEGSLILTGSFRGTLDLGGGPLPPGDFTPSGFLAKFSWDGRHIWSRGFTTDREGRTSFMSTVATDAAGNILLGGPASPGADLGGGPLSTDGAFFAKYTPTGSLLWVRIFSGSQLANRAVSVRAVDASTVAFAAYLGGTFTFGGNTYTGGDPESPDSSSAFVGTLSATGTDGWLRSLGRIAVNSLATGPGGTITLSGQGSGVFDLGGGTLGLERLILLSPFVARYSSSGSHLWSRVFDPDLLLPVLGQQPDGAVVVGATSTGPVDLEGRLFTPSGPSDLFYLQLRP